VNGPVMNINRLDMIRVIAAATALHAQTVECPCPICQAPDIKTLMAELKTSIDAIREALEVSSQMMNELRQRAN
jgi:hypothetical protein